MTNPGQPSAEEIKQQQLEPAAIEAIELLRPVLQAHQPSNKLTEQEEKLQKQ